MYMQIELYFLWQYSPLVFPEALGISRLVAHYLVGDSTRFQLGLSELMGLASLFSLWNACVFMI